LVDSALPFPLAGGVVACLGYELGELIEPPRDGITTAGDGPLAVLRRYDPLLAYDHARRQYTLLCAAGGARRAPWLERLAAPAPSWDGPVGGPPAPPARRPARPRRRPRRRAARGSERACRARDDRRPRAERPRPGVRDGQRRRGTVRRGREPPDGASPRVDRRRPAAPRRRARRPPARHLSRRL